MIRLDRASATTISSGASQSSPSHCGGTGTSENTSATAGTSRRGVAGARILARDIAQAQGAAPGGTYRNFGLYRAELQQAQTQYRDLLRRGNTFTRTTRSGRDQTYAYRFARSARPAVDELLSAARDQDDAIRLLINNGYLY